MTRPEDVRFMETAILLAREAVAEGEVPVGAVVVKDGNVIGKGRNRRERDANVTGHAEIEALANAARAVGDWRLAGCRLYVTLEPCPMCAGAIINSRVSAVIYGAADKEKGCFGSVINMAQMPLGSNPAVTSGVLAEECGRLLTEFFESLRKKFPETHNLG